jgi:hypothetical protein
LPHFKTILLIPYSNSHNTYGTRTNLVLRKPNFEEFREVGAFYFAHYVSEAAASSQIDPLIQAKEMGGPPTKMNERDIWY